MHGNERSRDAAAFLPLGVALLTFMALIMSQAMLHSTLEEKQQRIAEVLLGSARPFELMLGKISGGAAVSLTMVAIYLAGGSRVLRHLGYGDLLRGDLVGWVLLFVALGVLAYGALFAAVGAACNEQRETQNFVMPLMLVLVFPLMVISNVLKEPLGGFATVLSFVPLWTPMMMPLRLAATQAVPSWQPIAGALGALAGALVIVWAAGRVFRMGLLTQGKPPRLAQLLRWVLRG